jgi:hypothetical protein
VSGGGLYLKDCKSGVQDTNITFNVAEGVGGGAHILLDAWKPEEGTTHGVQYWEHTRVSNNYGAGIYLENILYLEFAIMEADVVDNSFPYGCVTCHF